MNRTLLCLLGLLLFASCSRRNLAYFSDTEEQAILSESSAAISNASKPRIQPDDLLGITVTSLSLEGNSLFNQGAIAMTAEGAVTGSSSGAGNAEGYLVDDEGFIRFPVLRKVKLGGLTTDEAREKLEAELQQYLNEPVVAIRYLNYRITVLGEVNRPSTFVVPSEKISILTALGMAGDMTPFGKRESVLLIREVEGVRTVTRMNLNSREFLSTPYFYLQQNDVVYVEPDKAREVQASTNVRAISIIGSLTTLAIIIATRIF